MAGFADLCRGGTLREVSELRIYFAGAFLCSAVLIGSMAASTSLSCVSHSCEDLATCPCVGDSDGRAREGECASLELSDCEVAGCQQEQCVVLPIEAGSPCSGGTCDGAGECSSNQGGGGNGGGGSGGGGGVTPSRVAAGQDHTCGVTSNGSVKCWGRNEFGALGNGTNDPISAPFRIPGLSGASAVAAGFQYSCALVDGSYSCWGLNDWGQLGNGTNANTNVPSLAGGIDEAIEIVAGFKHTLSLLADGTAVAWGSNGFGELGDGSFVDTNVPEAVSNLSSGVMEIVAGQDHTCARLEDGSLRCWGSNGFGQLGDGSENSSNLPVAVSGVDDAESIAAGTHHSCASTASGEVWCWGYNSFGQVGSGVALLAEAAAPVQVPELQGARRVVAGGAVTCAVLDDASVRCWGIGNLGQLGNGLTMDSAVPVEVGGLGQVVDLDVGGNHACALTDGEELYCWGDNAESQLGVTGVMQSSSPVKVDGF